jgi:hypothetical protein
MSDQRSTFERITSIFRSAGEDPPEIDAADSVSLPTLSPEQYATFDPAEHSDELNDIQARRDELRAELEAAEQAEEELEAAQKKLKAVKIRHKAGDATDAELEEARAAVSEAEQAVEDTEPVEEAMELLKMRHCKVYDAVFEAYREQAERVYEEVAQEMIQPMRSLYATLQKIEEMEETGRELSRRNTELKRESPAELDMNERGLNTGTPPTERPKLEFPPPMSLREVRRWLEQNDPDFEAE